jgi:hypothetical protein
MLIFIVKLRRKATMPTEVTFPDILETERLVLRRYSSADAPGIVELVEKNRDRLIRNFLTSGKGLVTT